MAVSSVLEGASLPLPSLLMDVDCSSLRENICWEDHLARQRQLCPSEAMKVLQRYLMTHKEET